MFVAFLHKPINHHRFSVKTSPLLKNSVTPNSHAFTTDLGKSWTIKFPTSCPKTHRSISRLITPKTSTYSLKTPPPTTTNPLSMSTSAFMPSQILICFDIMFNFIWNVHLGKNLVISYHFHIDSFTHDIYGDFKNVLLTRVRLLDRGVHCPLTCVRYTFQEETFCHLMLACPVSKVVWEKLNFWSRIMLLLSSLVDFSMVFSNLLKQLTEAE